MSRLGLGLDVNLKDITSHTHTHPEAGFSSIKEDICLVRLFCSSNKTRLWKEVNIKDPHIWGLFACLCVYTCVCLELHVCVWIHLSDSAYPGSSDCWLKREHSTCVFVLVSCCRITKDSQTLRGEQQTWISSHWLWGAGATYWVVQLRVSLKIILKLSAGGAISAGLTRAGRSASKSADKIVGSVGHKLCLFIRLLMM